MSKSYRWLGGISIIAGLLAGWTGSAMRDAGRGRGTHHCALKTSTRELSTHEEKGIQWL
jgi:hypothetical protein